MFIVGIDVAKRNHEVTVITSEGDVVCKAFRIANSHSGYDRLMERIRKLTNLKTQFIFAMESTAHYWLALYTQLRKDGFTVIALNPLQTYTMRELFLRKSKTDAKDSFIIAEVIRFGRYSSSNVSQETLLALKELCRNRYYLMDMASDLKRKVITLLDRLFPEYEAQFDSVFCKTSLAILAQYPTPKKLANANLARLSELLRKNSGGKFGEWKAKELKTLARNSFGIEDTEGAYSTLILIMLKQIQELLATCDALEKQINALLQQFDTTLTTIPGIGPILAATILSEIGDVSRFPSADKLAAYIGVDPSVNRSGEFVGTNVHMSKRGSPYLRRAVWMASLIAVQHDPMFKAYYQKKAAEGLRYMNIIGHVTKKMVSVIFAIMRDNKAYEPVMPTAA